MMDDENPSTELSSTEVVKTWVSIVLQQKHPPNHCEETAFHKGTNIICAAFGKY
jgi:hypothetical protein